MFGSSLKRVREIWEIKQYRQKQISFQICFETKKKKKNKPMQFFFPHLWTDIILDWKSFFKN